VAQTLLWCTALGRMNVAQTLLSVRCSARFRIAHRLPAVTNRVLLTLFFAVMVWSLIHPHDYFTWILEVFPAIIDIAVVLALHKRFPLTPLVLTLLTLHAIILMVGGHYTYAEVPLGFWMKQVFHFTRNNYDRIGHVAQGFVPALVAREVLIRRNVVRTRGWRYYIIVSICLAISAAYELLEWRVSVATGSAGDAFLGTQGDVWDTQKDMATALVAALIAPLLLGRLQDRQIARLPRDREPTKVREEAEHGIA
jgi:putative membrane protein